jgi:hypothetical protein
MATHAKHVTGLDIAPGMLTRAREAAQSRKLRNTRFTDRLEPDDAFDWINSFIVFQHMPPERGYAALADLLSRLTIGGVCSLHVTLFRERSVSARLIHQSAFWSFDGETARALVDDDRDPPGTIGMFDYDLNRVLALMAAQSVEPFGIAPTNHGGAHGAWLFARRNTTERILAPATVYGPATAPNFERFLGTGWSFVEEWGVWSDGAEATLEFRIDPSVRRSHLIALDGHAFLHPGAHERLTVRASVNGKPAAEHTLTLEAREATLALPAAAASATGAVIVTLAIDAPRSPDECGMPGDLRRLGFGLQQIELQPAQRATG